ncbi:MAG: PQQ-binding-like beta-propeller repeat protein [Verrucomicrobiae bacterium]|nr:PQQ-binding-like beta-propeller repeat protein [Verrucomicrobiae bacterium]
MKINSLTALAISLLLPASGLSGATPQWPQFRGPGGSGVAEQGKPPIHFGPGSNEVWRVAVPSGASSPCVWGDAIFLTAFSEEKLETLCVDRQRGEIKWRQTAPASQIEKFHPTEGSPASGTPATDGQSVVSYFGSCGLICHDFSGREKWRLELPTVRQAADFGSGASPIIAGNLVLLNRDQIKGSELLAVDLRSGKIVWRADRSDLTSSFSTPVVWKQADIEEVVLPGYLQMRAYDLKNGTERWRVHGLPTGVCTTPVVGEGLLFFAGWSPGKDSPMPTFDSIAAKEDADKDGVITYEEASQGMKNFFSSYDRNHDKRITREEYESFAAALARGENSVFAVRPGGQGDITQTHVAWKQTRGLPYVPSPLFYRGNLYLVKDGGMVSCFNARTGEPVYQQERIGALGNYYASPVAADGRIYVASVNGVLSVLDAGGTPQVLGRAEFKERLVATPAIVDNQLYVRTADHLWAFGE